MKTKEERIKSRMKNWRAVYAAFASGQKFATQKAIRSVAPIDHNLPYILIRLGYITAEPPYQIAKKTWDLTMVNSQLRAYYRERKPYQFRDLRQDRARIAPENSVHNAAASLLEEIEAHKVRSADAWIATDEELVHELRRRGYEVTARKTVEL